MLSIILKIMLNNNNVNINNNNNNNNTLLIHIFDKHSGQVMALVDLAQDLKTILQKKN